MDDSYIMHALVFFCLLLSLRIQDAGISLEAYRWRLGDGD